MTVAVTTAGVEDAPLVHQIMRAAFAEHAGSLNPPSGATTETVADVRAALEKHGGVIAWDSATPVGSARFELGTRHLYIGRLAVPPEYRGRGVGSAMTQFLEDFARESDLDFVQVGVRTSLPQNLVFFQRLGYTTVLVQPHPRGPDRIATLVKRLR